MKRCVSTSSWEEGQRLGCCLHPSLPAQSLCPWRSCNRAPRGVRGPRAKVPALQDRAGQQRPGKFSFSQRPCRSPSPSEGFRAHAHKPTGVNPFPQNKSSRFCRNDLASGGSLRCAWRLETHRTGGVVRRQQLLEVPGPGAEAPPTTPPTPGRSGGRCPCRAHQRRTTSRWTWPSAEATQPQRNAPPMQLWPAWVSKELR